MPCTTSCSHCCSYVLEIEAVDGGGAGALTGTATVTVHVSDLNDNTPQYVGTYDTTIAEDSGTRTSVFDVDCTDADAGDNAALTYTIVSGDDGKFEIDADSGLVQTSALLDRESKDVYELTLEVYDSGATQRTATATATVTISDVNDNTPAFSQSTYTMSVLENDPKDTQVGRVYASDADIGDNAAFQFSIHKTTVGYDNYFRIEPSSGRLYTANAALDREDVAEYELVVRVTDAGSPSVLWSQATVRITINDHNDNYPQCNETLFVVSVQENQGVGDAILTIGATDADASANAWVRYRLETDDATSQEYFTLDYESGVLTLQKSFDREATPTYSFNVLAKDLGNPALTSTCPVTVTVEDVNDNHPVFAQAFYSLELAYNENSPEPILRVTATDADDAENGIVSYNLVNPSDDNNFHLEYYSGKRHSTHVLVSCAQGVMSAH